MTEERVPDRGVKAILRTWWPWLLLLGVAATLHFMVLGERSLHHDESIHAKLSYDLLQGRGYRYDPTYHGPLLYYLTAATYVVLPDSDATARLPIAFAGIALVLAARGLRKRMGESAALWSGVLLTISPLLLFYGRFLRMDVLEALAVWGVMLAIDRLVRTGGEGWIALGFWLAIAVATKENSYVSAFTLTLAVAVLAIFESLRSGIDVLRSESDGGFTKGKFRNAMSSVVNTAIQLSSTLWAWIRERWQGLASACAVSTLLLVPIYTVGFQHPQDWLFPIRAIAYWWGQHTIERVGGPWWFHLPRLAHYEFLIVGAALVWVVRRRTRLSRFEYLLFAFASLSVVMYCYLGEKVPWLGVHQVWPFVPLAGAQLAHTFGRRGSWIGRGVASICLIATLMAAFNASFVLEEISPAHHRVESLHFVQTTPEFTAVAREGVELARGASQVELSASGEASWPLTWYWRGQAVRWSTPKAGTRPGLIVVDPGASADVLRKLGSGYSREVVPLRAWWLMEGSRPSLREIVDFVITRRPWGSIGSTDVVVLRRIEGDRPFAVVETDPPIGFEGALGKLKAKTVAEGWLGGPRGVAALADRIVVADAEASQIVIVQSADGRAEVVSTESLAQPEDLAWMGQDDLLIADTWNHRLLRVNLSSGLSATLAEPDGGWYGPRSIAVSEDGRIAVADTGNRRIIVYDAPSGKARDFCASAGDPPALSEPGGVEWLGNEGLLVCDTGNRRVLELDEKCRVRREVDLVEAWFDYYARPQIAVLGANRWLVSDTPSSSLWLIDDGVSTKIDVTESALVPTGLEWSSSENTLIVADLNGRLWILEVMDG